jgi:acyl-CoA thioesterase FadM
MVKKWPVLQEQPVTAGDLDANGVVRDDSVARWVDAARAAYLERCTVLQRVLEESDLVLAARIAHQPPGAALGRPSSVVVSAGATEIRPTSFTVGVRLRPAGGDREVAVNAACLVRLEDPGAGEAHEISEEIRDELIAVEHAARHYN